MAQTQDIFAQIEAMMLDFPMDFNPGSLVSGQIIEIDKTKMLIDIAGVATGIISGRDMHDSTGLAKTLKAGDTVEAVVINDESLDGLIVLSLKKASQLKAWDRLIKMHEDGELLEVRPTEANKGGLLVDLDGIKAFIPVSQLAPLHYPRVEGANAEKILKRLQELLSVRLKVKIISVDQDSRKLVLSERGAMEVEMKGALGDLIAGQKITGHISGIVSYGLFVTFNGLEGLVHISEIAWGHVDDPHKYGKVGDKVEVLVIGVDKGENASKISLSMKRLVEDPWQVIAGKYKIGDIIEGDVTRITNFGAFVRIEQDINGLIHLSEISDEKVKDAGRYLKVGDMVKARIIALDINEHRIGLSLKLEETEEEKAAREAATAAKDEKKKAPRETQDKPARAAAPKKDDEAEEEEAPKKKVKKEEE